jgi:hypothetical protein
MNPGPGKFRMRIRLTGACLWLASLMLPMSVPALQPMPVAPGYYPAPMASPYYQPQNPAPGPAPGYYWPPAGQPPYGAPPPWVYPSNPAAPGYAPRLQQPVQAMAVGPYLETSIESTKAYVHQNLVMTIQVISTVNLKTASAELQDSDDVIFRQLGDATVSTRIRDGQREIVNTLYYQLTPLRSGTIELEPVHVSGTMESDSPAEMRYDAVASRPVQLMVSAPDPGVQPWLPLHELELSATLTNDEHIGEGEPLTLTIEQRAVGMSGNQLPSPEDQLQAPGIRLYREKSDYQGTISKQGTLIGTRTDRFTLVPTQGSRLEIPAIQVDWWNVDRQRKETAILPGRLLNDSGHPGDDDSADGLTNGKAAVSWLMWLGLLVVAFLLGRYWPRLAPVLGRYGRGLWQWLDVISLPARQRIAVVLVRLSPQRNLHRLRRAIADSLPRSARLWFCVRSADEEQDADDWSQVLRFLIKRRLGLPPHLPMSKLAEHIIEIHPGADPDRIRALLGELEAALFSNHTIQDFDAWKAEFKHQIRPRLFFGLQRRQRLIRATSLPGLNPTIS